MARHGENIRKRKDGRWEGRYRTFHEEKGRIVYRSVYGKSYEEAKEKLFIAKLDFTYKEMGKQQTQKEAKRAASGVHMNRGKRSEVVLFSQVAEEWLDEMDGNRKYSTYVKYSSIYRIHLAEAVGTCRLCADEVPRFLQKISDYLSQREMSESMQKSIYCVANQILGFANREYSVGVPLLERLSWKPKKKTAVIFSGAEQARLLDYIYKEIDKFKMGVLLCLYAGLRIGELCALQWMDLDFQNKTLTVNRTVQRITVKGYMTKTVLLETEPKSESSKRTIPLTSAMMVLLFQMKGKHPYIFGGEKPLDPRTMQYRFKKILKEAGVDYRNFHTLRHTFATNCVENHVDVKALSEMLGHSDVKMTLNRYVHPTMDSKRKQLCGLADFYGHICGQTV